jgi:uncharacterized membrane protein YqaE (UPF0057 family)
MKKNYVPKKSKATAIVLAFFLGGLTWLYTYKTDAWKFWINLILCFCTFGLWGIITWVWAMIDQITKPEGYYDNYHKF